MIMDFDSHTAEAVAEQMVYNMSNHNIAMKTQHNRDKCNLVTANVLDYSESRNFVSVSLFHALMR